ncbi:MAG TPA: ribbon-helix-helix domain-containing protein [Solirubrobacteraceae bacterium]|jgi:predicted transcriptional regulator|nr:ribbon-helix-helix domain-containing protein [Solirubrobacteraceae bacterium]
MCREPTTTVTASGVPVELAEAVKDLARRSERSFSAELRCALREHVALRAVNGPENGSGDYA